MRARVLLTGGGGAGSEAIWRLLQGKYELHFADADLEAIDPVIAASHRHRIPLAGDPEFFAALQRLCKELRIDLLVPGVDEELLIIGSRREDLAPAKVMLPQANYVGTMLDKLAMIEALTDVSIPVPKTHKGIVSEKELAFPCILKPRTGRGSRNVVVVNTPLEAERYVERWGGLADDFILQEQLPGIEYTVQMVADAAGELQTVVPVRVHLKKGITIRAIVDLDPVVIGTCRSIHAALPASGCYNIQLILTEDGRALPFEINPRVSTTFCLVVAAGIDPYGSYLGRSSHMNPAKKISQMSLSRHWKNVFLEGSE